MRLKKTSLVDYTSSHVVNLISKDLDSIGSCVYSVPFLLTAPVELLIMSLLLLVMVGWEVLLGVSYIMFCTFLRCGVGKVYKKMHLGTAFFSDQRIALLSEVICGIRVIKMNVWEEVFEKLLGNSRRFVSRILSIYGYFPFTISRVVSQTVSMSVSIFVSQYLRQSVSLSVRQ